MPKLTLYFEGINKYFDLEEISQDSLITEIGFGTFWSKRIICFNEDGNITAEFNNTNIMTNFGAWAQKFRCSVGEV